MTDCDWHFGARTAFSLKRKPLTAYPAGYDLSRNAVNRTMEVGPAGDLVAVLSWTAVGRD